MEVQDIASNVASWLDNSTIEKLYIIGLLPSLSSISKYAGFWHSRVETLSGIRVRFDVELDWKQTYQILLRELTSNSSPNFWNSEDNALVSLLLLKMNYKPQYQAMSDAVDRGSVKILRFLLDEGSVDPNPIMGKWSSGFGPVPSKKICNSTMKILLESKRVWCYADILYCACLNDDEVNPGDCAEIVKLMLTYSNVIPSHHLFYPCYNPHTARMLCEDKRIDPAADNNMPLEQAIRRHVVGVVKVLLECPSVAQNISPHIREVAREFKNEEIIKLVC